MQKRRRSAKASGAKKKAAARRAAPKARAKTARRGMAKPPVKKKTAKKAAPKKTAARKTVAKKRTALRGLPSTYTAPAPHEGEELEGGMDVGLQSDDEVGPDEGRSTEADDSIPED